MKLMHYISYRLVAFTAVIVAFWSVFFYFEMMNEINDEVDDSLENYAETIIMRSLVDGEVPLNPIGSTNQFFQRPVTVEYAQTHEHIKYADRDVFILEKNEYEPARVLTYIYQNDQGQYFELEVSTPHIDKDDLRLTIFYGILSLFIALLLSIIVVNLFSLYRTMQPLNRLLEWVRHFQIGKINQPLDNPTQIQEFAQLNTAIEECMRYGQELFEQQKTFIGNASHEMQTPIAATMNRLETLLDDDTLTEEQMSGLLKAIHSLENMSQLNRSLLMLCKIDNGQFNDLQSINFMTLSEEIVSELQPFYENLNISLEVRNINPFVAKMDVTLARMMLSNLIKNAFTHNHVGGTITIMSDTRQFSIVNDGKSQPLDSTRIFELFYRDNQNVSEYNGKHSSTGIGLALVRAICLQSGLKITYHYEEGRHSFSIS